MTKTISFNQLANIGIHAPSGATSFHTEPGEAVYLIGHASRFERRPLAADAAARLMQLYKVGGSFGCEITGSGRAA